MIPLLLCLLSADTIDVFVDPVTYRSTIVLQDTATQTSTTKEILYLEFNCGIPYHELQYEMIDSTLITRATIAFKLCNLNKPDSLIDTLKRQFSVPSFNQAAREQISFIVQFGLHLLDGDYTYTIDITSGDKSGSAHDTLRLYMEDYGMSDLLLARQISVDTVGEYLRKGNLQVVPHTSHAFNDRFTHLFVYYEIYDIEPDTSQLQITYEIVNATDEVHSTTSQIVEKMFKSQAINAGLSIEKLDAGTYTLRVVVTDPLKNASKIKQTSFTVTSADTQPISYTGLPYYDQVRYFLSSRDYKTFLKLPEEGKYIFLDKFWSSHDYFAIADRFVFADDHFQEGLKTGSETERGRIYVMYGDPDEREKSFLEYEESKPYEHWQYFNGDQFIFVDIRGTSEYTLVWSSVLGEQNQPTLYKYLPETLRDQIK